MESTLEAELACVTTECECECEECESEEVAALRMSFCSDMGTFTCPAPFIGPAPFALAGLGVKSPSSPRTGRPPSPSRSPSRSRSLEGVIVIVPVTGPVVPALFSSWRDMTRSSRAEQCRCRIVTSNNSLAHSRTHCSLTRARVQSDDVPCPPPAVEGFRQQAGDFAQPHGPLPLLWANGKKIAKKKKRERW